MNTPISSTLHRLAALAKSQAECPAMRQATPSRRRAFDPVAYAAALEVLG